MTAAAAGALSEVEVLRLQARTVKDVVRLNVDGVTHEESLIQPRPGGNCLNWIVGHLVNVYESALPLIGQKPVLPEGAVKRYERGSPPLQDGKDALDFQDLMAAWDEAAGRFDAGLGGLTPEALDRPAPSPGDNPTETVRSLLTLISFHQAYHAGQAAVLRRITGKEGAIR